MTNSLPLRIQKFLDKVHGLIIVISPSGRLNYINQHAAELLGYRTKDLLGKNWFNHFIPYGNRRQIKHMFDCLASSNDKGEKRSNYYVETKSGELHLIEWKTTFLRNRQGEVTNIFSSGEDITEKHLLRLRLAEQKARNREECLKAILEATEHERQLLAYELHDNVNQVLTTCKLLLETEGSKNEDAVVVKKVAVYIQEVINTLRELAHNLNPAEIGKEGLYDAVTEMVNRVNETGRIRLEFKSRGLKYIDSLSGATCLSLYRIMQEAVNNIVKHAGAAKACISLSASESAVDLEIEDNGRGFNREKKMIGLGLRTIYTRAEAAGGKAYIQSSPGEGTLLSIHIPILQSLYHSN